MKLTIVTTMRNEGPYLVEWLAHHRAAGATDFVVFSNNCDDGSDAMLDALDKAGEITHIRNDVGKGSIQWRALKSAWEMDQVQKADWVGVLDCDEFVVLGEGMSSIPDALTRMGGDLVVMPWRLFGSSGHAEFSDAPVTERFTLSAPYQMLFPPASGMFKSFFQPKGPFRQLGVHRPKQKNKQRGLPQVFDGSGRALPKELAENDEQIMLWGMDYAKPMLGLHHYSVKSAQEFLVKRLRGLPNRKSKEIDLTYWVERNFNLLTDRRAAPMRPATLAEEERLLKIKGLKKLRSKALEWHERAVDEQLADPEGLKLYGRLILSGTSTPPDRESALKLVQAYQAVHG